MKNYDLLQDRNLDENCSNGVWNLSHELMCELLDKLAEYEDTGLTPQEIIEMRDDATELFNKNKELENLELKYTMNWDALCDWLGDRIASDKDCENGCEYDLLKKVNEIKNYNGNYTNAKNKIKGE